MFLWKFLLFSAFIKIGESIFCYQCNSTQLNNQFECGEFMDTHSTTLNAQSCDNVYGAKYCIKQIGHLEASGILCYQCYAATNLSCTDLVIGEGDVKPEPCDHVFEAAYCVKTTGLYAGGVGTRRFCSSSDLGNYCDYIRQVGDTLPDYRSCFYTCYTDGCNAGSRYDVIFSLLALCLIAIRIVY